MSEEATRLARRAITQYPSPMQFTHCCLRTLQLSDVANFFREFKDIWAKHPGAEYKRVSFLHQDVKNHLQELAEAKEGYVVDLTAMSEADLKELIMTETAAKSKTEFTRLLEEVPLTVDPNYKDFQPDATNAHTFLTLLSNYTDRFLDRAELLGAYAKVSNLPGITKGTTRGETSVLDSYLRGICRSETDPQKNAKLGQRIHDHLDPTTVSNIKTAGMCDSFRRALRIFMVAVREQYREIPRVVSDTNHIFQASVPTPSRQPRSARKEEMPLNMMSSPSVPNSQRSSPAQTDAPVSPNPFDQPPAEEDISEPDFHRLSAIVQNRDPNSKRVCYEYFSKRACSNSKCTYSHEQVDMEKLWRVRFEELFNNPYHGTVESVRTMFDNWVASKAGGAPSRA